MDRGAWWASVHGVAKSQTRLSTAQQPGVPRPERVLGLWAPELSSGWSPWTVGAMEGSGQGRVAQNLVVRRCLFFHSLKLLKTLMQIRSLGIVHLPLNGQSTGHCLHWGHSHLCCWWWEPGGGQFIENYVDLQIHTQKCIPGNSL